MSRMFEVPEELFERLERAAAAQRLTPLEWLDANVPAASSNGPALPAEHPRSMGERLAGRLGRLGSGTGEPPSDRAADSFAEYLEEKQRAGRL